MGASNRRTIYKNKKEGVVIYFFRNLPEDSLTSHVYHAWEKGKRKGTLHLTLYPSYPTWYPKATTDCAEIIKKCEKDIRDNLFAEGIYPRKYVIDRTIDNLIKRYVK